jgi:hypothetical protein
VGKFSNPREKDSKQERYKRASLKKRFKQERYKKASLKKRIGMTLIPLHNLGNFRIRQPMLFFEQRARPP